MDYLQYILDAVLNIPGKFSFKPYYKWITFNISLFPHLPLILFLCFKPYYKWITFNMI